VDRIGLVPVFQKLTRRVLTYEGYDRGCFDLLAHKGVMHGRKSEPLGQTPKVVIPILGPYCRRAELGVEFFGKLPLTRIPGHIRPTRRGPDPNRPTYEN